MTQLTSNDERQKLGLVQVFGTDVDTGVNRKLVVNSEGSLHSITNSHPDSGWFHFHKEGITATQDFILIDISDTTNYPHANNVSIHLDRLFIQIDSSSAGVYQAEIGFLENVDATNGDFYGLVHIFGTKTAGQQKNIDFNFHPNGPDCRSSKIATSDVLTNQTAFQTDVNLASTLDPTTANVPSGNGDIVLRITMSAGEISITVDGSYHSHDGI